MLAEVNEMFKLFYETFYKLDQEKIAKLGTIRKHVVDNWHTMFAKTKNPAELFLLHNTVVLMQKIFDLVGPSLVLKL